MVLKAVELFSGAGGLGLGISLAGFKPLAVVEWDRWACDTLRENQRQGFPLVTDWPVIEGDVRQLNLDNFPAGLDLVAGGPPCQPFSIGGKHGAHDDSRDMFPAMIDIIRALHPRAFIIENVKGLTRSAFANYFQYILLQLEFPEVERRPGETWSEHLRRLQSEKTSARMHSGNFLTYNVVTTLANAANFGIPQKRERVFIVGFRGDLGVEWSFPRETHSLDELLRDQWVTGDYWNRHCKPKPRVVPPGVAARCFRLRQLPIREFTCSPWRTIRDALMGLPDPEHRPESVFPNHRFQPGAKTYPGHTGSVLDLPSKTLKAGDHGVPGGENMIIKDDGSVRYLTVRESARLQTFPDGYLLHGSWTETMRQLGNAVPVSLAQIVASSVARTLIQMDFPGRCKEVGDKAA
ncbi:MAG: DNA cytosine methyltransferase [Magnetococcales bacterium]|nr:DNA cytosine methyltransferase [Magnetococcales bacterium]MBF0157632.1 DNA cytosine methyltransferase [Magnetococcales bacterium]